MALAPAAAERLIDIAYAPTAGDPLQLSIARRRLKVPVANGLHLERELRSNGDRLELELELTWSGPRTWPQRAAARGATSPSSRARATASLRVCASSFA
jgi:hypothetical protein